MSRLRRLKAAWGLVPILVFVAVWEIAARVSGDSGHALFPPFSMVVVEFYRLCTNGVLGDSFLSSLGRVLAGFCAGSIAGLALGLLMGWKDMLGKTLQPIVSLLYPIPVLGWLPVLMLWVGINEMLPVALIFICAFFPVLYNTIHGVKNVDRQYIQAARLLGASDRRVLSRVVMPMALPSVFTGLRLEAGMAWRAVIAAEMIAIPTGIGALLMKAESLMRMDIIIVCLAVLAIMCLVFERAFALLENRLTARWR